MSENRKVQADKITKPSDSSKEPSALEKAPDVNQHRNASSQDISEVEKHRTNKSSGSLKEDSFSSVEITAAGHSASRHSKLTEKDLVVQEKHIQTADGKTIGQERENLLRLAREQAKELTETSELGAERRAAAQRATEQLLNTARECYGAPKIDSMHVGKEDLGTALSVLILGPDICSSMGPKNTRSFGEKLLVFGIAPTFGANSEAQKQFSQQNIQHTLEEGGTNFALGTALGGILERCHPAIILGAAGTAATTFLNDQFNSPDHRERNQELNQMSSKIDNGTSLSELLRYAHRSSVLLGPDVFKGTWAAATGGIGLPQGIAMGDFVKQEIAHAIKGANLKEVVGSLGRARECIEHVFAELFSERFQFAGAGGPADSFLMHAHKMDGPEPVRSQNHHPVERPDHRSPRQPHENDRSGNHDGKRVPDFPGDLLGSVAKIPQRYQLALERVRPSPEYFEKVREIVQTTLDQAEQKFLKIKRIPTLAIHAMEDINANPTAKACYEPQERAIYLAEKVRSLGQLVPTTDLEFDLHHEFAHAMNWLLNKNGTLMEGDFQFSFMRDLGNLLPKINRQDAMNMKWLNKRGEAEAEKPGWLQQKGVPGDCLRDWQDIADHVLADAYAHAAGFKTTSFLSNWHIRNFPDSVAFVRRSMPEWKKLINALEENHK